MMGARSGYVLLKETNGELVGARIVDLVVEVEECARLLLLHSNLRCQPTQHRVDSCRHIARRDPQLRSAFCKSHAIPLTASKRCELSRTFGPHTGEQGDGGRSLDAAVAQSFALPLPLHFQRATPTFALCNPLPLLSLASPSEGGITATGNLSAAGWWRRQKSSSCCALKVPAPRLRSAHTRT